jgi:AmmeMemoRadiSam system protein B/AmmeMemoRadiSam system protein A
MIYIAIIMLLGIFSKSCAQDAPSPDQVSYRPATVARAFYPDNPNELKSMIIGYLDEAKQTTKEYDIHGLVVPHAGYVFSGKTAAIAYKQLIGREYDAVVIIAPSHVKAFSGSSVFKGDGYVTPLGVAKIDKELAKSIAEANEDISYSYDGHEWSGSRSEHSIEVQVPFLQIVLPNVPIVPISMGEQDNSCANDLFKAITSSAEKLNKKILIVASTDLSHFHNLDQAEKLDMQVVDAFDRYDYFMMSYHLFNRKWEACGSGPMVTAMMAAEYFGANSSVVLEYSTSADNKLYGDTTRVVGYMAGAMVYDKNAKLDDLPELNEQEKSQVIDAAKQGVRSAVLNKQIEIDQKDLPKSLQGKYSAFVTITKNGELRACMGHTFPQQQLMKEVHDVGKLAATSDYRFGAVRKDELDDIEYEVSLMSRMRRIMDPMEVEPGKDGLYIRLGGRAGLLLPQVAAERNWDKNTFLENICLKAGLPINSYKDPDAEIYVFKAVIIH